MPLVDTHCHLQSHKFDDDREEVIRRSLEALDWVVVIGDDLPSSEGALALVRDRVFAAVGVHPYYASGVDDDALAQLRALCARLGVVALGEIGLDYCNMHSPKDAQHRAFHQQLALACDLGLPVVIHNRDADADTYPILKEYAERLPGCIMHCFGSSADDARRYVDLGFHIAFAGNVTFPKAQPLRDAASVVPIDRLLIETDAPYLAPPPLRGKRCEPHFVQHTAACLAELRGIPFEEFCAQTTENARRVYRVSKAPAP